MWDLKEEAKAGAATVSKQKSLRSKDSSRMSITIYYSIVSLVIKKSRSEMKIKNLELKVHAIC